MPLDVSKILQGDPIATAEFLDDDYNSVIAQMDHGIRQRKFRQSQENMQQQLKTAGQTLVKTFLSPLRTEREGSDVVENITDAIPGGGALKAGVGAAGMLVGAEAAKTAFGRMAGKLPAHIGPEGLTRVEISDAAAKLKVDRNTAIVDKTYSLEQVLDHPLLYDVYPNLKQVPVKFRAGLPGGSKGQLMPSGRIELNIKNSDSDLTLLHEIQHKIQRFENFARGGSPQEFVEVADNIEEAVSYYKNLYGEAEARAISNKYNAMRSSFEEVARLSDKRKGLKEGTQQHAVASQDLTGAIKRLKQIESIPITSYISRDVRTEPLLVTTSPLTENEILGYQNIVDDWIMSQQSKEVILSPTTKSTFIEQVIQQNRDLK